MTAPSSHQGQVAGSVVGCADNVDEVLVVDGAGVAVTGVSAAGAVSVVPVMGGSGDDSTGDATGVGTAADVSVETIVVVVVVRSTEGSGDGDATCVCVVLDSVCSAEETAVDGSDDWPRMGVRVVTSGDEAEIVLVTGGIASVSDDGVRSKESDTVGGCTDAVRPGNPLSAEPPQALSSPTVTATRNKPRESSRAVILRRLFICVDPS